MQRDFYKELDSIQIQQHQIVVQSDIHTQTIMQPNDINHIHASLAGHDKDTNQLDQPNYTCGGESLKPIFGQHQTMQNDSSIDSDKSISELRFELDTSSTA
eukprot:150554_1